jgi:hypothetical protein
MPSSPARPRLLPAAVRYWSDLASSSGAYSATRAFLAAFSEFVRDSAPSRLRQRYGDAEYDWDHRVNTTSAAVGWRDRLLGVFHSAYQPTEPGLFQEMLSDLKQVAKMEFCDFTFLDLGSGKGRTLLMASDYPFRRIVGVELLPSLHQIAQENLGVYKSASQQCFRIESICADATAFSLPPGPLLIYLFNPFPESGLRQLLGSLQPALNEARRPIYLLYHNPQHEHVLAESGFLSRIGGTHQYSEFRAEFSVEPPPRQRG